MIEFFIFLIGICIGSFMNVCIYRIPVEESLIPSSHCKECGYKLKIYDLIPLFSYLFLKGKCRSCSKKISIQYSFVESINGFFYLLLYLKFGFTALFIKYAIIGSILLVLALIDYNTKNVYTIVSWSGITVSVIFVIINFLNKEDISSFIIAAVVGLIVFEVVNRFSKVIYKKQGLGGGDMEVLLCMGLTLGVSKFFLSFFISVVFGSIVCILGMIFKKIQRVDYVPFVPFLAVGSTLAIFFGDEIISVYLGLIIP